MSIPKTQRHLQIGNSKAQVYQGGRGQIHNAIWFVNHGTWKLEYLACNSSLVIDLPNSTPKEEEVGGLA